MQWPVFTLSTIAAVIVGVAYLLYVLRAVQHARDDIEHYRLTVRFWFVLAVLGALLALMFAQPMTLQNPQWVASSVGRLTLALLSLLPVVVIASGLRNATVLWCAHRRRVPALTRGVRVEGHVVERGRRMFGHDLVSVVVEADVPQTQPGRELAYRERGAALTRKVRFAETCPGDYFTRFAPGQRVALKVDLQHPDCFALLLFD